MNQNTSFSNGGRYRDAPPRNHSAHALARGLGWLSIGLGVAEILRPREMSRAIGMQPADRLVRGYGARELLTGAALLTTSRPEPYVWARVAGDVLDIATVGAGAVAARSPQRGAVAMLALIGVMTVDVVCALALRREAHQRRGRTFVHYGDRTGFPRGVREMRGVAALGATQRARLLSAGQEQPAISPGG